MSSSSLGVMCASCELQYYKEDGIGCVSCGSSQMITTYIIIFGIILVPMMVLANAIDGNKHDGRFGLYVVCVICVINRLSIVITWCQYTALFMKIEINWTNINPGGPLLRYLSMLTSMFMFKARPEVCHHRHDDVITCSVLSLRNSIISGSIMPLPWCHSDWRLSPY